MAKTISELEKLIRKWNYDPPKQSPSMQSTEPPSFPHVKTGYELFGVKVGDFYRGEQIIAIDGSLGTAIGRSGNVWRCWHIALDKGNHRKS